MYTYNFQTSFPDCLGEVGDERTVSWFVPEHIHTFVARKLWAAGAVARIVRVDVAERRQTWGCGTDHGIEYPTMRGGEDAFLDMAATGEAITLHIVFDAAGLWQCLLFGEAAERLAAEEVQQRDELKKQRTKAFMDRF